MCFNDNYINYIEITPNFSRNDRTAESCTKLHIFATAFENFRNQAWPTKGNAEFWTLFFPITN